MALVISAVKVTGTATAYTVPAGKIAKVRVVNVDTLSIEKKITIGNYVVANNTDAAVKSENQSQKDAGANSTFMPQVGFVFCGGDDNMTRRLMYIKEDHVLVAGQTVSCDDAGCTMSYTIFQEDV